MVMGTPSGRPAGVAMSQTAPGARPNKGSMRGDVNLTRFLLTFFVGAAQTIGRST